MTSTQQRGNARFGDGGKPASKKKRSLLGLIKVLVAVAILGWIGSTLPWDDQLSWHVGERSWFVLGDIEGDWKQDAIEFRAGPSVRHELKGAAVGGA